VFALRKVKQAFSFSPKTHKQVLHLTKLPERTLRYNLSVLRKEGLLKDTVTFGDMRKRFLSLKNSEGV
jgi:hypothetical protein